MQTRQPLNVDLFRTCLNVLRRLKATASHQPPPPTNPKIKIEETGESLYRQQVDQYEIQYIDDIIMGYGDVITNLLWSNSWEFWLETMGTSVFE